MNPVRDDGATYDGWTETVALNAEATEQALWAGILELRALLPAHEVGCGN
jgi:hypothetical protein